MEVQVPAQAQTQEQAVRRIPILLGLAALIIIIAGMRAASAMIVRFLLALLIAFICGPLFFRLKRYKLPQWLALLIVLLLIGLFGGGLVALIGASLTDFRKSLPIYQENLQNMLDNTIAFLANFGFTVDPKTMLNIFDPNLIMTLMGNLLTTLTSIVSDSFLITLYVIFMLLEAYSVPMKIRNIWGEKSRHIDEINRFVHGMQRYLFLKTVISLATGAFIYVSLLIIGVDFALLWGMLAFLLNYIPNIGSIIAAIPPILLSAFMMGWASTLAVGAVYLTVNNVIGSIIEPKVMGKGLDLSTLVVFVSLIFWGWVLGPIGMLLSVPLTMSAKMYLEGSPSTRWLAMMLAGEPVLPKKAKKVEAKEEPAS